MQYKYRALNSDGGIVNGVVAANNERDAARALRRQGLNVVEVKEQKAAKARSGAKRQAKKQELLMYVHQLATLLESKVSLEEAVDSLSEAAGNPAVAEIFEKIGAGIRRGQSFSQALKQSGLKLPSYFYPLTEAGELTGKLDSAIRDAVKQWEYELEMANELRNALIYPLVLICCGVGAVMLIFALVVPKFSNLLNKGGAEIPFLAEAVLSTGMFVNQNMAALGVALVLVAVLIAYALKNPEVRGRLRDQAATLPLLKEWFFEAEICHWSAMLATLLENRVSLINALELAQSNLSLSVLVTRMTQVTKKVRSGAHLSESLKETGAITSMGYNLIRVGEKSGELPTMLRSLAKLYTDSVRNRTKRFLVLLEPLAIILIGAVIGTIMAGIILAIVTVNEISF